MEHCWSTGQRQYDFLVSIHKQAGGLSGYVLSCLSALVHMESEEYGGDDENNGEARVQKWEAGHMRAHHPMSNLRTLALVLAKLRTTACLRRRHPRIEVILIPGRRARVDS